MKDVRDSIEWWWIELVLLAECMLAVCYHWCFKKVNALEEKCQSYNPLLNESRVTKFILKKYQIGHSNCLRMECMWVLIRLNFSFWLGDGLFIISKGILDKYRVEFELIDFIFNLKKKQF